MIKAPDKMRLAFYFILANTPSNLHALMKRPSWITNDCSEKRKHTICDGLSSRLNFFPVLNIRSQFFSVLDVLHEALRDAFSIFRDNTHACVRALLASCCQAV